MIASNRASAFPASIAPAPQSTPPRPRRLPAPASCSLARVLRSHRRSPYIRGGVSVFWRWRKVCEYAIAARLHDVCARGSRVHGYYLADCWLQLPTAVTRRTTGERKVMRKRLINLVCLYWYRSHIWNDRTRRPSTRDILKQKEPSTRSTGRTPRRRRVVIAPGASVNSSTKGRAWRPRNDGAVAREMTSVRPAPRS